MSATTFTVTLRFVFDNHKEEEDVKEELETFFEGCDAQDLGNVAPGLSEATVLRVSELDE